MDYYLKASEKFRGLLEIMEKLRSEEGCEWDRKQTHKTLKPYVIEEAYEVAAAIDSGDTEELKKELGDLLLQSVFHAQIGREESEFDISEVLETLNGKLIRRHPHVFKNEDIQRGVCKEDFKYSYRQWEEIKASEKGEKKSSRVGEINNSLPSLVLSRRIQENASAVGFDWKKKEEVFLKIEEELEELKEVLGETENAVAAGNTLFVDKVEEELGDFLFSVVNMSRFLEIDPETALRKAAKKFVKRFRQMEEFIEAEEIEFEKLDQKELDIYWEKAKKVGF